VLADPSQRGRTTDPEAGMSEPTASATTTVPAAEADRSAANLSAAEPAGPADESLVAEELLVEEVSIDGMCGVY
jgi:mycofactocin precursor